VNLIKFIAVALLGGCSIASAQDGLFAGHVQRVVLQPSGAENCPPPCPVEGTLQPNGLRTICVSNAGGCQTMDVKVDQVYLGEAGDETRRFESRIGEWGPSYPVTEKQIIVGVEAGRVSWSLATVKDGRIFIDPKRLRSIAGVPTATKNSEDLVALDEVLAKVKSK